MSGVGRPEVEIGPRSRREVIEDAYPVTVVEEARGDVSTDESSAAGDQKQRRHKEILAEHPGGCSKLNGVSATLACRCRTQQTTLRIASTSFAASGRAGNGSRTRSATPRRGSSSRSSTSSSSRRSLSRSGSLLTL